MGEKLQSYRDLIVWQKSIDLVVRIYETSGRFPEDEKFGLASQMRRAAVSIPSNIAEGRSRGTKKDFVHFLRIAYASGAELETHLEICQRLARVNKEEHSFMAALLEEVMKMLNTMIYKLRL